MFVREMTRNECTELLSESHLARLACARDGQPYIVPIYIGFAGDYLYSFSMPGRKIDWMRGNPRVCVEIDKHGDHRGWRCVIVSGAYEELSEVPKCAEERERAWALLSRHANWWEPGALSPEPSPLAYESRHLFYRIRIDTMTGRQAVGEALENPIEPQSAGPWRTVGHWFRRVAIHTA
ncbi:pyridoxamine 5'-phosphate oxidase family protein [Allomesorhizobium camelthorni]|uniref:Pyridoxamine 5'-phosphate oxidase family protein n=1 Tax=Allomesorhizobium camelthorni TaxID=475069 RepID=A0A6G4W710_9HYPH|nr:pyridoxamine 5'-phosphate oxidase family protein [Mesorhizobium camelthorni]NGO50545.1 pyridoxamine 5'-phosphate oxidase family protein [Mesorhizobium camelthorni]